MNYTSTSRGVAMIDLFSHNTSQTQNTIYGRHNLRLYTKFCASIELLHARSRLVVEIGIVLSLW